MGGVALSPPQSAVTDHPAFPRYSPFIRLQCPVPANVSFTDGAGVTHSVSIAAGSLYEAAARGMAELKRAGFAFADVGPATQSTITVEGLSATHELPGSRVAIV